MKRWTLELADNISVYCDADGWGCIMDHDGTAMEINDHDHAFLFVHAHKYGRYSEEVRDGEEDFLDYERPQGARGVKNER